MLKQLTDLETLHSLAYKLLQATSPSVRLDSTQYVAIMYLINAIERSFLQLKLPK